MSKELTREQVIDILRYIGVKVEDRGKDNIQFCCPVHGESNPSMGYSFSKGICHCFSCHFSGTIEWLLYNSLKDEFRSLREAERWIKENYNVDVGAYDREYGRTLRRYGEEVDTIEETEQRRHELPKSFIAPFKSGKETYKYFFDRGFTKATMQEYLIGRDINLQTITIPIFHQDGILAGVIGRYIDPNRPKNYRYEVYDFPKGTLLYPIHKFEPLIINGNKIAILCEGNFDSLWLHQNGYRCALATQGNALTKTQAQLIKDLDIDIIVLAYDNDKGGKIAIDITKKNLGDSYIYRQFIFPEDCKDPQDMSKEQLDYAIEMAVKNKRSFRRL